jgi:hypothetical protein
MKYKEKDRRPVRFDSRLWTDTGAELRRATGAERQASNSIAIDVSPRDEIVFALAREGPHELWMAKLQ